MSNNYATSSKKPNLLRHSRFVVTYEDDETGNVKTFSVWAALASIAVSRTVLYIEENKLHEGELSYTLLPTISKEKTDYEII